MNSKTAIRRIKLAATISIAIVSAIAAIGKSAIQIEQPKVEVLGLGVTLEERLGSDDGVEAVFHFSGDTHGSLEPCG